MVETPQILPPSTGGPDGLNGQNSFDEISASHLRWARCTPDCECVVMMAGPILSRSAVTALVVSASPLPAFSTCEAKNWSKY